MDKRWIGILVILIIGAGCMYLIVDSSTSVGSAITVVNKTVFSIPDHFSIDSSTGNRDHLINENTNEKIYLKDLGKQNIAKDKFNNEMNTLKSDSNIVIVKNVSEKINSAKVYSISYENLTTENATNSSINYVYNNNHTYLIKMDGYSDASVEKTDLTFIIKNMKHDFKQGKD